MSLSFEATTAPKLGTPVRASTKWLSVAACETENDMGKDTLCHFWNQESENMAHFILNCKKVDGSRREILILQWLRKENEEEILGDLLFNTEEDDGQVEGKKEWLYNLWKARQAISNLEG